MKTGFLPFSAHAKVILLFILGILVNASLAGCAPMPVKIISDRSFDFKNQKSYFIVPNTQEDLVNLPLEKTVIDQLITESIDSNLASKGYSKLSDNPQLLVSYYLVPNTRTDVFVVNKYYTELGFSMIPGQSSTRDHMKFQEVTYDEGILIIDVIDAATNVRVWQGFLTSRSEVYKKEKRTEQRFRNAVYKILKNFYSHTGE